MASLPTQIGNLTLVRQLGVGKHCQIWEAVESQSVSPVAVKVIDPEMAHSKDQSQLLEHELAVSKQFAHPGLIRIKEFFSDNDLPRLVMESFPHPNLKQRLADGTGQIAPYLHKIAMEIAMALEHMHSRGWVHRDIKPDNVLLDRSGRVKVIDFAISTRKPNLLRSWLGGQQAQGSPSYIAPEQIRGRCVDRRADIYSLGCTFFELVTGQVPYSASTENDLLNKHISAPVPTVRTAVPSFPVAAERLIRRMMAKQASDRPQSMQDVIADIGSLQS
jgi:serine/threonine protein kinase